MKKIDPYSYRILAHTILTYLSRHVKIIDYSNGESKKLFSLRLYEQSAVLVSKIEEELGMPDGEVLDAIELLLSNKHILENRVIGRYSIALTEKGVLAQRLNFYKPEKKNWFQRNPFWEKLILLFIGAILALIANLAVSKQAKLNQRLIDKQQDSLIKGVSDSLSNFEKVLKDSSFHK